MSGDPSCCGADAQLPLPVLLQLPDRPCRPIWPPACPAAAAAAVGLCGCGHPSAALRIPTVAADAPAPCCCCEASVLMLTGGMPPPASSGASTLLPWMLLLLSLTPGPPLLLPVSQVLLLPGPVPRPLLSLLPLTTAAAVDSAVKPAGPPSKPRAIEASSAAALCCSLRWLKLVALSPKVPARCRARPGDPIGLWCDCDWPEPARQYRTVRHSAKQYSAVQGQGEVCGGGVRCLHRA